MGYQKFKIVDQTLVELQTCPDPAREGIYCAFDFKRGNSGLFGEELPGDWFDIFEAIERYKAIFHGYMLNGDSGLFGKRSLFDLMGGVQALINRHLRGLRGYTNPAYVLPKVAWYDTHATLNG